jgi:hypothetical protein
MADKTGSRNLNARDAVEQIRGPLTNAQVMENFKISAQGFADLLKQLFQKKLITEEDLARRGIRFKVVKPAPTVQQTSVFPPPPVEHDDEFLDTVTLTDMLTFKGPEKPPPPQKEPAEIPIPEDPKETQAEEKKGKFSLTGLFKKAR